MNVTAPAVGEYAYPICIGTGVTASLRDTIKGDLEKKKYSSALVVFDPILANHPAIQPLFELPSFSLPASGEAIKSFSNLQQILQEFATQKLDRHSVVIAVGGGATGDAVSFAASLYMRGVSVIQVPTTLLAMVDSSIGGKTAVNLGAIKNLIGTFLNPNRVDIDLEFLPTLSIAEYRSGFAEIIKHAVIDDTSLIADLKGCAALGLENRTSPQLARTIEKSLAVKKRIVEADPFEKGVRKILNFGHSAGHAFESYSHKTSTPLLHGEAVMLGMLFEAHIAAAMNSKAASIVDIVKELGRLFTFDLTFPQYPADEFISALSLDKKNSGGDIRFSLSFST